MARCYQRLFEKSPPTLIGVASQVAFPGLYHHNGWPTCGEIGTFICIFGRMSCNFISPPKVPVSQTTIYIETQLQEIRSVLMRHATTSVVLVHYNATCDPGWTWRGEGVKLIVAVL